MAAGLAEHLFRQSPADGPVTITSPSGHVRWQELWQHNPAITTDGRRPLVCGGGALPYLVYPRQPGRLTFSSTYRAADYRGHLYLTDDERAHGRLLRQQLGPYVFIEPHGTDRLNVNRRWDLSNWQAIAAQLARSGVTVVQAVHPTSNLLDGAHHEPVTSIRDSASLIGAAALVLAPEGGIPFIAAALDHPAVVVLWGGCVSATTLSYPEHINLVEWDANGCGSLTPCDHCAAIWSRLLPDHVVVAVHTALEQELVRGVA